MKEVIGGTLRLTVLGPVTVRRGGDPVTTSLITQPRHLALLCYLSLARPRGLHERDTLIALLWPEYDESRGRRALRNALHGLRLRLGPDAIITAGDHLVGLDPAHVWCDAIDLECRNGGPMPRGPSPDADDDSLTPGPFEGLHVSGAAPFDNWMSAQCDRLRALLAQQPAVPDVDVDIERTPPATVSLRRPHAREASMLYARGHYLFLRSAHGGSAPELLLSRENFEQALQIDPGFAPAVAGLANFYAVAARRGIIEPFHETFARAIALSEEALAMDSALAIPHVHFAVKALYLDDDWERARMEFDTAVHKEPDYAEAHRFRGVLLGMMRCTDDALAEMEIAARMEPDMPHMLSSLGAARLAAGDRTGAESALRSTLLRDPRHAPARQRLLLLMEEDGRFEEALAERVREPVLPDEGVYRSAFEKDGADGYRRVVRESLLAEARELEPKALNTRPVAPNDIFSPPIVRLVSLYARLGDWKQVRSWRLVGVAARPGLGRWFEAVVP